jgi:hypothetical protein
LRVWVEMPAAAPRPATERGVRKIRLARGASLLRQASVDNVGAKALRLLRHGRFVRSQTALECYRLGVEIYRQYCCI